MAVNFDPDKSSLLRAAPRLMQILRVLVRYKFLSTLAGKGHWPRPTLKQQAEGLLQRMVCS